MERGSTRFHYVENSLWKKVWNEWPDVVRGNMSLRMNWMMYVARMRKVRK
jgi:hypothetical protein